jgi:hypothetical protein
MNASAMNLARRLVWLCVALPAAALLVHCGGDSEDEANPQDEAGSTSQSGGSGGSSGTATGGNGGSTSGGSGEATGGSSAAATGGSGGSTSGGSSGAAMGGSSGAATGGSSAAATGGSGGSTSGGSSGEASGGSGGEATAGSSGTGAAVGSSGDGGTGGGPTQCQLLGGVCDTIAVVADPCASCPQYMSTAFAPAPPEDGPLGCTVEGDGSGPLCCLPVWTPQGQCTDSGGECYPPVSGGDACPTGWNAVFTACPEAEDICCIPGSGCP